MLNPPTDNHDTIGNSTVNTYRVDCAQPYETIAFLVAGAVRRAPRPNDAGRSCDYIYTARVGVRGRMSVMKVSQKVAEYVGSINRGNVQRALQTCLLSPDIDTSLFRQLAALDVQLEVEQTALLHIDDKARNFNNPARLANTYSTVRDLLKADDGEKQRVDDGWDDLLIDNSDNAQSESTPQLTVVEPADHDTPPTGDDVGSGSGVDSACGLVLPSTAPSKRHRLDTLTRRRIEIALRGPRPNKAEIARTVGVSRSTVDRISKDLQSHST